MKKGFMKCPYCANEIREGALKCQYCKEFLEEKKDVKVKSILHKRRKVNKSEKWSARRKRGLALVLILPITAVVWFFVSLFFWLISAGSVAAYDGVSGTYSQSGTPLIVVIKNAINWILGMFSLIGIIGFIPGLIMLIKSDTDYDPYINLKTKRNDLIDVYKNFFEIDSLPNPDINEMQYHGFVGHLHIAWAVIINILTLGLFGIIYTGMNHSNLPIIKRDDFTAGKAIGFLFIPFFNLYWVCVFWLRFVNRINFQFKLRGEEAPVSKGLAIAHVVLGYIPYLNILSQLILGTILIGQIQHAINRLASENE